MRKHGSLALLIAMSMYVACTPASATPVTYDVSGTVTGGGTFTGDFTYDSASNTIANFMFELPTTLPSPSTPPSGYEMDKGNSFPIIFSSTHFQFDEDVNTLVTVINLDFANSGIVGTLPSLSSTLTQGQSGFAPDYLAFINGSVTLASTPLPESLPLLASGLMLLAILWGWPQRRQRMSVFGT